MVVKNCSRVVFGRRSNQRSNNDTRPASRRPRYAVRWPDVLAPSDVRAEIVGRFGSGEVAAIAHGRTVSLSVPLESVFDVEARAGLMEEALRQVLGE